MVSLRNLLSFGCVSHVQRDTLHARLWPCVVLGALAAHDASGAEASRLAEAQFRVANPCPVTGRAQGACVGYVIDRVIPLACGGADHPDNMRWLTAAEAKAKAKWEKIGCRPGRRLVLPHEMKSSTEAFALGDAGQQVQGRSLGVGETATAAPVEAPVKAQVQAPVERSAASVVEERTDTEQQWPHE
jgi:hypothetical protein